MKPSFSSTVHRMTSFKTEIQKLYYCFFTHFLIIMIERSLQLFGLFNFIYQKKKKKQSRRKYYFSTMPNNQLFTYQFFRNRNEFVSFVCFFH